MTVPLLLSLYMPRTDTHIREAISDVIQEDRAVSHITPSEVHDVHKAVFLQVVWNRKM
jgi:hypothetical protein